MNLRWMFFNHLPPGVELTSEQRRELRRRVKSLRRATAFRAPIAKILVVTCIGSTIASAGYYWGLMYLLQHRPSGANFVLALVSLCVGYMLALQVIIAWTISRFSSPFIRTVLNQMSVPVCMACGYNLDHLGDSPARCPECGAACPPIGKHIGG